MSFSSEYNKLRNARMGISTTPKSTTQSTTKKKKKTFAEEYNELKEQREAAENIAPLFSAPTTTVTKPTTDSASGNKPWWENSNEEKTEEISPLQQLNNRLNGVTPTDAELEKASKLDKFYEEKAIFNASTPLERAANSPEFGMFKGINNVLGQQNLAVNWEDVKAAGLDVEGIYNATYKQALAERKAYRAEQEKTTGYKFDYTEDDERYAETIATSAAVLALEKHGFTKTDKGFWEQIFQAGSFSDGYDFGDVTKSILGTAGDALIEVTRGFGNMGEGLVDLGMHGTAMAQDWLGFDEAAEETRKTANQNYINEAADDIKKLLYIEKNSFFGNSADKAASVVGSVLPIIATGGAASAAGAGAVGSTAATTGVIFGSSMGSGISEAYNAGATDGEAWGYGAMKGSVDAVTEMIFGGIAKGTNALGVSKGISSVDDAFAKAVSSKMTGRFAKNVTEYAIKAGAEGTEEVLAEIGTAWAKSKTYMSEKDMWELIESEDLLESFILGTFASGVTQGGDLVSSVKTDTDFITGLTTNEEAVIEKEVENRIAEAEKDGTKLSNKDIGKIREQVEKDLEKGFISTDTIEEVLGGETYNSYKETVESEEAILKEFEELGNKQNPTLAEQSRYAELKEQVKEIKENSKSTELKTQLSESVFGIASNDRLVESYNEKARRSQAYEADLTKYDTEQQKIIQNAIDSGILNNTNRTHEFVDMVAKISADKGVSFNFTNNAKLKDSGFAIDGKTVNGYVTKDGITVNMDSAKYVNSVVGHEITHVLEGTELYTEMQNILFEYAKSKGDYQGRFDTLTKLYEGVKDADVTAELTADLVGDYLFTDSDFISKLSVEHRNVFQKIYDEIKYLFKIATAGSKEARQLEKVKRAFDKAYKESGNAKGDTQYSLTDNEGKNLTKEQNEYFKDSKMRDENGNLMVMYHGSQDAGFHVFDSSMSDDDTSFFFVDRNDVAASYSGTTETYEAQTIKTAEDMNNFIESIGAEGYEVVEKDGKFTLLYEGDRVADSNTAKGIYEEFCWYEGVGDGDANYKVYLNLKNPLVVDAEGRNWNNISREYSQEIADRYNSLNAEEKAALANLAEWGEYGIFKDEMLEARATAEQGGSGVFDEAYTKNLASAYEKLGGANANLYDAFSIASENFSEESIKQFANKQMNTRDYAKKAKAEGYDGVIFKNIHDNGGYSNGSEGASTVAIAFNSNQIKSVANAKPTANADIRYSISGVNAKTANESMLLKAEQLLNNGVDSETVRQETGWYKGYDGKMRFEINDADMDFNINGHFTNPDVIRHRELEYKFITDADNMTEAEMNEMRSLTNALKGVKKRPTKLGDYLKHDKLFEAYPQLKDIKLSFDKIENGALGKYRIGQNEIVIDNSIRDNKTKIEQTLIHEIQHAIQDIEGFANGASVEYWKSQRQDIVDTIRGARENLDLWLDDIGYLDFAKNSMQEVADREKTLEQHWEDCKEFKANSKYAKQIAACEAELAEFQRQYDEITNGMTAYDQYYNTAGEIEARDTENRLNLDAEGRRNTRPDIDRENVIFADTRYSLSEATDKTYLDAVNRGDTEKAQKIVDDVAKSKGYTIRAYHGTPNAEFTVFDKERVGKGNDQYGAGYYFTSNKTGASHYGNRVIDSVLNIKNPIRITANGESGRNLIDAEIELTSKQAYEVVKRHPKMYDEEDSPLGDYFDSYWEDGAKDWMVRNLAEQYREVGYLDSDLFRYYPNELHEALRDVVGYDGVEVTFGNGDKFYVAWFDNQMKSADAITYDNNGNVIPLSQRFNAENNDIRYSLSQKGETPTKYGNYNVFGKDLQLPMQEPVAEVDNSVDNIAPVIDKAENAIEQKTEKAAKPRKRKLSKASLVRFTKNPAFGGGRNLQGAYNLDGKQYLSDGIFVAEFDSIDEKLTHNDKFPVEQVRKFLNEALEGQSAEKYSVDFDRIVEINKNNKDKPFISVGGSLYNAKYIEAIMRAIENPIFALNNYRGGYKALVANGDNGRAMLMPVRAGNNLTAAYEAEVLNDAPLITEAEANVMQSENIKPITDADAPMGTDNYAPPIGEDIAPMAKAEEVKDNVEQQNGKAEKRTKRAELHKGIVDGIKTKFAEKGLDLDMVLRNAKNLSTFTTVDNIPQRVMEKALGYKEGQILADETVNKVAHNETEGIKWLNSFTDRKNGLLAQISKRYNIKPGSKESAAAQMYAEGFYVDENENLVEYGDAELKADFPNAKVRENIKGLASDPRIRRIYDETLASINESRSRNAYPEIPRLDNYFLHFRAMEDTFSRLGLPFNPNDIRAKDLPTDLNGVTADLKPGQPYFASAMHRNGKRTSFDLLGGLERYLSSAKNQIYHIDDIQTLRALRNYIADNYGQAKGLESLDLLTEEEAQERIKQVYGSHLSTFAKFLNEEANILAGKTSLIDRGLEGVIGRRGITFIDTVNKQVGANMVGLNVSSSLTNFLAGVQAIAKTNKFACVKSLAQTTSSKIGSIFGKTDSFVENNPTIIRRKGAERFYRTPFQKAGDAGYVLMSAVDNVTTEFIVRAKYNEFIKKGMSEQQAVIEADKWTSRLMGDRSLGQMPHLYNSKMLGLVTKFQLEVRNQLDSQFYDTIQETKASNEDIKNGLARNAKTAAKVASTFFQLAVLQHVFGKAFESVAGYNPAFDIIGVISQALGLDDDDDSEDTVLDNIEQAFLGLLEDLPYTSTFTGGRIPISSALPIEELVTGKDEYGNEKSRLETLGEIAPYYFLPGGYGQFKKTAQGLSMFDDDLPIAGSYTDKGDLRFPVDDTFENRLQAGIFGQWSSDNARDYFDNGRKPLNEKQIQEFIDVDMPIQDYWEYREGLSGLKTLSEQADYINSLDLPTWKKNILINNIADRKEAIDMTDYSKYGSFEEFDFAQENPEKYDFLTENGVSYEKYQSMDEDSKEAYNWAFKNPEKFTLSKAVASDVITYRKYTSELYDIKADKDENGKSISGSRKEKVLDYINNLDADYGEKIILFKSEYNADDTYNYEIIDYLNSREDISYDEMETILTELDFNVHSDGTITWD